MSRVASRVDLVANISDVASRAGVAPSVVSRVLSKDPTLRIRDQTRARVEDAVQELAYTPNSAARTLRTASARALGLVIPDVANPLYAESLRGIQRQADEVDYVVLLASADDLTEADDRYRRLIVGGRIDGVLMQRGHGMHDEALRRLATAPVPTVLINSRLPGRTGSVVLDDAAGARVAVDHLLALGHRRIGHLTGPPATDTAGRRRLGYEEALAAAGVGTDERLIATAGYDPEAGREAMRRLLTRPPLPTALFVAHVFAAVGALQVAQRAGLRVPEELSIVALHDTWFAEHTNPALTTVKMPLYEMGRAGCRLLLDCLAGAAPADLVVGEPAPILIERGSTNPPA